MKVTKTLPSVGTFFDRDVVATARCRGAAAQSTI
jgi:hypothetical protein